MPSGDGLRLHDQDLAVSEGLGFLCRYRPAAFMLVDQTNLLPWSHQVWGLLALLVRAGPALNPRAQLTERSIEWFPGPNCLAIGLIGQALGKL